MKRKLFAISLLFSVILFTLFSCSKPIPPIKPPDSLAGLKLKEYKTGKEAIDEIFNLHGRKMGIVNGYVATYAGKEGKATVYYSVAKSKKLAQRLIDWMVKRIGEGNKYFQGLKKEHSAPQIFYSVHGEGGKHFFLCKDDKVIWIIADPQVANPVMEDFLTK